MILIADSGSSKTDWRLIKPNNEISQAVCSGINPYYHSKENIYKELETILLPQIEGKVDQVYFYGAGCSSKHNVQIISDVLAEIFPSAKIEVNHDLLAAARSLCGQEEGIACILGTGTSTCLFDGKDIVDSLPSMGFIMADEGSGAYLGKQLLNDYFRRNMPQEVHSKIENKYDLSRDDVLNTVYQEEKGSKFLASFSTFIIRNIKTPYLYQLATDSFDSFFNNNILKYNNYKNKVIHFTGSVAYSYSDILRRVATNHGVTIKHITRSPISGLTLFHK